MNYEVKTEISPLSEADVKKIRKTAIQTLLILPFVIAVFGVVFYQFFSSDLGNMKYFIYFFIAFFILVIGVILYNILQSLFSKEKIVMEGYVTNKRLEISRSNSGSKNSGSKSTTNYYISLGLEEMSVAINFYNQVKKGDYAKVEKTIKNKEVFNIEVLKLSLEEKTGDKIVGPPKTVFSRGEDTKTLRNALLKTIFLRSIVGGAILYVVFLIASFIVVITIDKYLVIPIYIIRFVFVGFYILLNRKTYQIFLDMRNGEKIISTEKILDVYYKGYRGSGTSLNKNSYYVSSSNNFSFTVDQEMGESLKSGDLIQLSYSPKARILLDIKKADSY